jgi:ketopantoate hydroxymethyltransferase
VEGLKKFVNDVNSNEFPTPKNIVGIEDNEYEKFLNKIG